MGRRGRGAGQLPRQAHISIMERTAAVPTPHSRLPVAMKRKLDRTVVKRVSLHEAESDAAYWRTRPAEERLECVETIRREYHDWPEDPTDEDRPRLQRVCHVRERP